MGISMDVGTWEQHPMGQHVSGVHKRENMSHHHHHHHHPHHHHHQQTLMADSGAMRTVVSGRTMGS
eukprot:1962636-Amphidinium_carterae.1